ncbi:hypothetical protein [Cohaesibacter celericrescens]|uniref:Uncharacterized protein n=1 Tax=Cohaesibacter celericrescens TaxID=2067669 RepID=A0A2N5XLJ9_9HYPH|nr:hypothetical protein [Cohaesibacter celericrescens]PLW75411.1 hypothetical protein C0081_20305 [Cohaesibacter celericrescens]
MSRINAATFDVIIPANDEVKLSCAGRYFTCKDADGEFYLEYDEGGSLAFEGSMGHSPGEFNSVRLVNKSEDPITATVLISDGPIDDNRSSFSSTDPIPVQIQTGEKAPVASAARSVVECCNLDVISDWTAKPDLTVVALDDGFRLDGFDTTDDFRLKSNELASDVGGSSFWGGMQVKGVGTDIGKGMKVQVIRGGAGVWENEDVNVILTGEWQTIVGRLDLSPENFSALLTVGFNKVGATAEAPIIRFPKLARSEIVKHSGPEMLIKLADENSDRRHLKLQNTGVSNVWIWVLDGADYVRSFLLAPFEHYSFEGRNALAVEAVDHASFVSVVEV